MPSGEIATYERMALTMLRRAAAAKHEDARETFIEAAMDCIRTCLNWEPDRAE